MKKKLRAIVFCDTENKELDVEYADQVRQAFRDITGWKVENGTRIWLVLGEFSKGYSKKKRNTVEVATIFCLAEFGAMPHRTPTP